MVIIVRKIRNLALDWLQHSVEQILTNIQSEASDHSLCFEDGIWGVPPAGGPLYCSYLLPKQTGGTTQIPILETLGMIGRPALHCSCEMSYLSRGLLATYWRGIRKAVSPPCPYGIIFHVKGQCTVLTASPVLSFVDTALLHASRHSSTSRVVWWYP